MFICCLLTCLYFSFFSSLVKIQKVYRGHKVRKIASEKEEEEIPTLDGTNEIEKNKQERVSYTISSPPRVGANKWVDDDEKNKSIAMNNGEISKVEDSSSESTSKTEDYIMKRRKSATEMLGKNNKVAPALRDINKEIKDEKVWYQSVVAAMPANPLKKNSKRQMSIGTSNSGVNGKKLKSKNATCFDRIIEILGYGASGSGSVAKWAGQADHIVSTSFQHLSHNILILIFLILFLFFMFLKNTYCLYICISIYI